MKVVRLPAVRTSACTREEIFLVHISVRECVETRTIVRSKDYVKYSNDTIMNRSRDLSAFSTFLVRHISRVNQCKEIFYFYLFIYLFIYLFPIL